MFKKRDGGKKKKGGKEQPQVAPVSLGATKDDNMWGMFEEIKAKSPRGPTLEGNESKNASSAIPASSTARAGEGEERRATDESREKEETTEIEPQCTGAIGEGKRGILHNETDSL
eukprot:CAMPEP_0119150964 /NCGR_PEP_ID=MMETSP1310-20130426/45639_1 /TAXON_ID=464262 /ORGANISM="Genus nov. species nov., Strain RCC2339" /LENGTH=114 /DNA_ID=CAMNT_0007143201 /DNA_START=35 /DNA_END=376 /DNA_ORIENTATION=-